MSINILKKIHFVGIGGIGISATAKLMALKGKTVSGSDYQASEITKDLEGMGIKVFIRHNKKNLFSDTDLLVHSLAIPLENPELLKAKKLKIPILTYPELLGELMKGNLGIAVAGTHGKSTTTAIIGFILEQAGLDPTVIIGSKLKAFKGNVRLGKSKYFVVEADEYGRGFLKLFPQIAVITNIEEDHLDYYQDLEDIISAFKKFTNQTKETLIVNGDDKNILKIVGSLKGKEILTFGQKVGVDLRVTNVAISKAATNFKVIFKGNPLGRFSLRLPGTFNVYNALGAIGATLQLGVPIAKIKKGLSEFSGLWRRFEQVGKYKEAMIISDYAHHPTAIRNTIEATRQFFPKKKIIAVFQPHQHSRTKKLFKNFIAAFDKADLVILSEIFDVAGRENFDQDISSKDLAKVIRKRGKTVFYAKNLKKTRDLILENIRKDDIVLIMGAGNIYKLANELASLNAKCKVQNYN